MISTTKSPSRNSAERAAQRFNTGEIAHYDGIRVIILGVVWYRYQVYYPVMRLDRNDQPTGEVFETNFLTRIAA
jgi:hypothetical protein